MKFKTYSMTFPSFGIMASRDVVLSQWEPYEVIQKVEPYLNIWIGRRCFKFWVECYPGSWMYRTTVAARKEGLYS